MQVHICVNYTMNTKLVVILFFFAAVCSLLYDDECHRCNIAQCYLSPNPTSCIQNCQITDVCTSIICTNIHQGSYFDKWSIPANCQRQCTYHTKKYCLILQN